MTNNEKHLRDRLYQMEASYPDDMWERIASNLPEKKNDKKLWLFFLIFILTAMIPGSMYWTTQSNKDLSQHNDNVNTIINPIQHYEENNLIVASNDESSPLESINENQQSNTYADHSDNNQNQLQNKPFNQAIIFSDEPVDLRVDNPAVSEVEQQYHGKQQQPLEESKEAPLESRGFLGQLSPLSSLQTSIEGAGFIFDTPECPSFGFESSQGIYIDFVYSHDYGIKSLSPKSQEFAPYATERENTEKSLYSFSAGLRIAYISDSGFGLKTGFNYSQINEKFEYVDPDASLIRTIITIDTLLVGGVPTVVSDTATIRIPGSLDITAYNKYRFFDIPILATYEAYLTDKIYYTINAGALINLSFTQKGRFLDPSGQPVWFTSSDPAAYDAFKMTAGLSLFGSVGLHYYLTPQMDFILEPNIKLFTGSLTNDAYPLNQKWITGGLITGIRYKF